MNKIAYILILIPSLCISQDLHIRNTQINITGNALVSVNRSLINRGQINNEGVLQVRGNWVNAGSYNCNEGILIFNGQELQFISQGEIPIRNVVFSKGRKHISESFHVRGRLSLDNTLVFVPNGSGLYLDEFSTLSYQEGDRVIGALFMTGNDITFPVGTPDEFLPIRLELPDEQVLQIGVVVKPGLLSPTTDQTIASIADYYWEVLTPESYQEADVTLNFQNAEFLQQVENARVGEAQFVNDVVKDAGSTLYSGSPNAGTVTTQKARGPYFTVARKHIEGERPPINVLNLISPNDDGFNDYLMIENIEAYPSNTVSIFDRWGTKLYEASAYDNDKVRFDGVGNERYKQELEQGSYFYVIDSKGETLSTGFFELVR